MTDELDRALMAAVINRQMERHAQIKGPSDLTAASGMGRQAVWRARNASPKTTAKTWRAIEAALGLGYQVLDYVGKHDIEGLRQVSDIPVPDDLIRWIETQVHVAE